MTGHGTGPGAGFHVEYQRWYKWGQLFLLFEMLIAIGVTVYSAYMALTGAGGLGGH